MKKRTYGYARVSSQDQRSDRQVSQFLEYGIDEPLIFVDKESGKDFNRKEYQLLKHLLNEGDVLVIASIDRLGRNYDMILEEWQAITKGIKADIIVLDMPLLDTTQNKDLLGSFISDLILQILSYVAEQERSDIKKRQREGIQIAKSQGVQFGRPQIEKPENFEEIFNEWQSGRITAKQAMIETGLKRNTFYKMARLAL
ncbi:recombinase family protein [Erysipelothrix sp. HDW6B]|uniref:recombinase family protein n=1 Tax=Erysipelothrix sp. HDW6B TaxID=2714929 RepID=UPI00140B048A|nr:recombinase family protein [Erysipelothrix sp. HDW6B]QIK86791.1 recombinase family protein [Erysipelothrix sp. HDW6B]